MVQASEKERQKWSSSHSDLENKLTQARNLNSSLQSELDAIHSSHAEMEKSLRAQLDQITSKVTGGGEWKIRFENLDTENHELRAKLLQQEKTTSEVKHEATGWLNQMKALSEHSSSSYEREEKLVNQVHEQERELEEWKNLYAKTKAQVGAMDARGTADPLQFSNTEAVAKDFVAQDGLVKDVDVTTFQIAVDELLRGVRGGDPEAVLGRIKSVIIAVRNITLDLGTMPSLENDAKQQLLKRKAKLSATSNNLITAGRNFSTSKGLLPVSLLDAAASHVAAAVVEIIHLAKIHRVPAEQVEEDDDNSLIADSPADYYGISHSRASAGGESIYSLMNSPRRSQIPSNPDQASKPLPNGMANGVGHSSNSNPIRRTHPSSNARMDDLKVSVLHQYP